MVTGSCRHEACHHSLVHCCCSNVFNHLGHDLLDAMHQFPYTLDMIKSINDNWAKANGTSLIGYITTTYAALEEKLGEPVTGGDKTTAEWCLEFKDGSVATIYDWKCAETPLQVYDWHIGGQGVGVMRQVQDLLGAPVKRCSY